jgi:hypothetical protein
MASVFRIKKKLSKRALCKQMADTTPEDWDDVSSRIRKLEPLKRFMFLRFLFAVI